LRGSLVTSASLRTSDGENLEKTNEMTRSTELIIWTPPTAVKHLDWLHAEIVRYDLCSGSVLVQQNYQLNGLAGAVWTAGYVLAIYLESVDLKFHTAIELGAGVAGIPSIALARKGRNSQIIATDGESQILDLLAINLRQNQAQDVRIQHLKWGQHTDFQADLILAADCTYSGTKQHFLSFLNTCTNLLRDEKSIILLAHTSRYPYDAEYFIDLARNHGFIIKKISRASLIRALVRRSPSSCDNDKEEQQYNNSTSMQLATATLIFQLHREF